VLAERPQVSRVRDLGECRVAPEPALSLSKGLAQFEAWVPTPLTHSPVSFITARTDFLLLLS
jgi:hypothetical protein